MEKKFIKHAVNFFMVCCTLKYVMSFKEHGSIKELLIILFFTLATSTVVLIRDSKTSKGETE